MKYTIRNLLAVTFLVAVLCRPVWYVISSKYFLTPMTPHAWLLGLPLPDNSWFARESQDVSWGIVWCGFGVVASLAAFYIEGYCILTLFERIAGDKKQSCLVPEQRK